ncbi:MAG: methionine adenosyltransferase [Candidatus Neomarinimicrobiota bacterium]|nr:methionine adenosyltransferase [Candidatus Neomarinimicrobiota bacterium]
MIKKYLFTSESVTEGHPDKVCDQISDAILDSILKSNPNGRVACETLVTTDLIVISGEITTDKHPDYKKVALDTIKSIGYNENNMGFSSKNVKIQLYLDEQSSHIAQGVDEKEEKEQGAGDQGLMFGFACNETPELMPFPIQLSHRIAEKLAYVRKNTFNWLKPDGKTQVTVEYENNIPKKVVKVVLATQHDDMLSEFQNSEEKELEFITDKMIENVIIPVLEEYKIPYENNFVVNGTGRFVEGGPKADTGLTGRKIIVDTYGGYARHGGGAFSGKDPSKVDRSAAYFSRYVAKNIVAAGLADKCEIQVAYSIGIAEPVSVSLDTFGTGILSDSKLTEIIIKIFNFKPAEIIKQLNLKLPMYEKLGAYGHFGREEYPWEKTDKVDDLKLILKGING